MKQSRKTRDIINCSYVKIKANGRISRNILARKQVLNQSRRPHAASRF